MTGTITSKDERTLLDAVKQAAELVDDRGMVPNAAIEKVARDAGFGPGKIRLVAQAYNTGRQTNQWQEPSGSILDKMASYELADPEAIIAKIYSGEKQAAATPVHSDYSRPPVGLAAQQRVKAASAQLPIGAKLPEYPRERVDDLHRAFGKIQRTKQAAAELSRQAAEAGDLVRLKVAQLVDYMHHPNGRLPFDQIETAATTYFGKEAAAPLLNIVYARAHLREKRAAADAPTFTGPINQRAEPFTLIAAAINAAADCFRLRKEALDAQANIATVKEAALRPFSRAGESKTPEGQPEETLWSKEAAGILGTPAAGAFFGSMLSRGMGGIPKGKDELVDDAVSELDDPDHANELRKIRAHALLNSLLTDHEDPISGHDPDAVLAAYNEINAVAPRTAENAATLRPVLRQRLEGNTQPFESQELLNTEKGLTRPPNTNIMNNGPKPVIH